MASAEPEPARTAFALALDAAIEESGLSLERLRHHLAAHGVAVSRASLSYWRTGRSRPERASSLDAVSVLEDVLNVQPGTLKSLLGPPAPRGRWLGGPPERMARHRLWPALHPISAELKPPPDGHVRFWSVHDTVFVDDRSRERQLHVRLVAEAMADRVDRIVTFFQSDSPDQGGPVYEGLQSCTLGRVLTDHTAGLTVGELMLDRVLAAGEVAAVTYTLRFGPGHVVDHYHRRFTRPAPLYVCQVQFGSRAPRLVRGFEQRQLTGPRVQGAVLPLGASHAATFAARDVAPGIVGVRWDW
jgi:hypothetical protein